MKLWAKLHKDERIIKNTVVEVENLSTYSGIVEAFMKTADELKIATPIITRTNAQYFFDFNSVKFVPSDFVETVNFDFFTIERG